MRRKEFLTRVRSSRYISIRSGKNGLGDSLYLQAIARHLLNKKEKVEVCTYYPEVFSQLKEKFGGQLALSEFRRSRIDRVAHYVGRKTCYDTDQFEDCCLRAEVGFGVELKLDWTVKNTRLVEQLRKRDKPVICVQLPRSPMGRDDGFGDDILPDCGTIQKAIDLFNGRAFIVQIGKGKALYKFKGIDLDLANCTTIRDLLDVASVADGFLGYCSFIAPLAESFAKPLLLVWSRKVETSEQQFVRSITPRKIFHLKSSRHVMDDCEGSELAAAVDDLYCRTWKPEEVAA